MNHRAPRQSRAAGAPSSADEQPTAGQSKRGTYRAVTADRAAQQRRLKTVTVALVVASLVVIVTTIIVQQHLRTKAI